MTIGKAVTSIFGNDMKSNKAVYTVAFVADGWAGAENPVKRLCDGQTDIQTSGPMDRKVA